MNATLMHLLKTGDYARLEEVAAKWRRNKEPLLDGTWKIVVFCEAFSPGSAVGSPTWPALLEKLEAWKAACPDSVMPRIVKANAWVRFAWAARGTSAAYKVTEEGWRLFRERLGEARAELEAIRPRRAECPHWSAVMQTIALGQEWNRAEYDELFEEAVHCEPGYPEYYVRKARHLQAKWYGRKGEWEAFAKSLLARYPDGTGEELYAWIIMGLRGEIDHEIKHKDGRFFRDTDCEWPLLKAGFERLRAKYPRSLWLLNKYALFAGKADDRETTNRLLLELGDRCDMSIWVTWENVAIARMWAAGREPPGARLVLFR